MEIENSAKLGEQVDEARRRSSVLSTPPPDCWRPCGPSSRVSGQFPIETQRDVITVAIIHRPRWSRFSAPRGRWATRSAAGGAFDNAREPLGQAFEPVGGGDPGSSSSSTTSSRRAVTRRCLPTDPNSDQGDGQSCFNADRIEQADALAAGGSTPSCRRTPGLRSRTSCCSATTNAYTPGRPDAGVLQRRLHRPERAWATCTSRRGLSTGSTDRWTTSSHNEAALESCHRLRHLEHERSGSHWRSSTAATTTTARSSTRPMLTAPATTTPRGRPRRRARGIQHRH